MKTFKGESPCKPCIKCGVVDRTKRGDCRPCANNASVRYRAENPEKVKATKAKYRTENLEKVKASTIKWRKNNPERIKATGDKWKKDNFEKNKATHTKWYKDNPEARRTHRHNRRAREKLNGGKLSNDLVLILFKRQKGECVCCKKPLGDNYHLDHIMPLKLGGANEDYNIQLLRPSCNRRKGAKHPVEYMQEKGFLV